MSRNWIRSFFEIFRAKQKECPACGAHFECASLSKPCWCREVKLTHIALAGLKSRYTDCLCPNCLNEAAKKGSSAAERLAKT
ncbi:MAG: cysteine-rich CWC family protein [Terriglobia bacterium]